MNSLEHLRATVKQLAADGHQAELIIDETEIRLVVNSCTVSEKIKAVPTAANWDALLHFLLVVCLPTGLIAAKGQVASIEVLGSAARNAAHHAALAATDQTRIG